MIETITTILTTGVIGGITKAVAEIVYKFLVAVGIFTANVVTAICKVPVDFFNRVFRKIASSDEEEYDEDDCDPIIMKKWNHIYE